MVVESLKNPGHGRNYLLEGVRVIAGLLTCIGIFGFACDKICHSEEKASEARKRGYDV